MTFEFDGKKYNKASSHQKEWGSKIISELKLRGDESVLDLGCGDGVLTSQFAEILPNGFVLGIDASQGMIDEAGKIKKHNLRFETSDINKINFTNEFDLVFSNAALHWIKDHELLLSNVYKSLKKGGIIRFNFAAEGNCSNFYAVIREMIREERYESYFEDFEWPWYMPDIEEYKNTVSQFSFEDMKIWGENADRFFPDIATMIGWIDQPSIVPFLKCVDSDDKTDFRNSVVNRMIKKTLQDDGTCFETFRRINVYARKYI